MIKDEVKYFLLNIPNFYRILLFDANTIPYPHLSIYRNAFCAFNKNPVERLNNKLFVAIRWFFFSSLSLARSLVPYIFIVSNKHNAAIWLLSGGPPHTQHIYRSYAKSVFRLFGATGKRHAERYREQANKHLLYCFVYIYIATNAPPQSASVSVRTPEFPFNQEPGKRNVHKKEHIKGLPKNKKNGICFWYECSGVGWIRI